jgi:hypothetical protein
MEGKRLNAQATKKEIPVSSVELSADGALDPAGLVRLNIMLSNEVLAWLDSAARAIHRASGTRISRSEIVRGILGGFVDANPLFSGCSSELHLRRAVGRLFDAFAMAQRANQSTQRPAPNTAPAPRQPQANGAARPPQASDRRVDDGKAMVPLPAEDNDVQDQANSDFDLDAYMQSRGYAPKPGYTQRSPRAGGGDRAKVGAAGYGERL